MKAFTLRDIALAGLIAAVYTVLGLAFYPVSFGVYQVRVAEALTVLPFVFRAAIPGLFIGCMLTNVYGGQGWQDIVFGSLVTLVAAFLTRLTSRLSRTRLMNILSAIPVLLLWSGGLVLISHGDVLAAVIGCAAASAGLLLLTVRSWGNEKTSGVVSSVLRVLSLAVLAAGVLSSPVSTDWKVSLVGAVALLAAWIMLLYMILIRRRGENPNLLAAPLPPVILNAFGVSLYLAPILEFNYWFVVQMIGVGQLIACYVLGLPLLRLLMQRRSLQT